jgi:MoaA/NifB/PqqE/SkfB family radical SAM enzyme
MKNYWDEFEYNKLKLLNKGEKVDSIIKVSQGLKAYDELFPISVDIHLTNACNLCCEWCTDKDLRQQGATLEYEKVTQLMDEFLAAGTGMTLEGGGEPTLHPRFKDIVHYAYERGASLGLITNGTRDISDVVHQFKWIRVSLDSSDAEQYMKEKGKDNFNQVIANLRSFSKARNPEKTFLGVGYVMTKRNLNGLDQLIDIPGSISP